MDPALELLLGRLPDDFRDIRDAVRKAVQLVEVAPDLALVPPRKVLDAVIRDVYQRRCNEPPGTRPLEGLVQQLVKKGHMPPHLEGYTDVIRVLGNTGAHHFGQALTVADVRRSLSNLLPILEWYIQERPEAVGGPPAPETAKPAAPVRPPPPPARVALVPKGLRSFDAGDADFFLDLLPGPRDKEGLPESIRFWKNRIEAADDPAFTVGVLYGPSGCGKSSLVKAGLLPLLAKRIQSVYVEATPQDTEARLLKGLRKRRPDLPADLDLTGAMAALRQGEAHGRKVLIVLDQFEQWLHARRGETETELARALRQCDGERVQCVVLVRDDFWMALSRFMGELNIELVQGQNAALVDLFDPTHARNVLAAFGRAYGRLHEPPLKDEEAFLDQAVAGLSQDGRIISVRLALFAEMVKGKPWAPATLRAVGGAEGVGIAFLEETFGASAGPRNRRHQEAARAVLRALLPEQGSDIKGAMQPHGKLLEASGYARRPADFEELVRILDGELRLITPTEPGEADTAEKFFQLTHDYLVHSVREWLVRKQKETRRGRAELRLAERAALWNARPENPRLPSLPEWLNIRTLTRAKDWTPPQRKMMRRAARHHAVRGTFIAVLLAAGLFLAWFIRNQIVEQGKADHAADLVKRLLDADTAQTPDIIREMEGYRRWTDPLLRDAYADAEKWGYLARTEAVRVQERRRQLHAALGLAPVDPGQVDYLYGRLLDAEPSEAKAIIAELRPYQYEVSLRLMAVMGHPEPKHEDRLLRAAAALAVYYPEGLLDQDAGPVVEQLVKVDAAFLPGWMEALRPVRDKLLRPLAAAFRDRKEERTAERILATSVLADYTADRPEWQADLLQDADEQQFVVLFPKVAANPEPVAALLSETLGKSLNAETTQDDKERLAKRQANAAVALMLLGQPDVLWPLLKHSRDPRVRSYLIHYLSPRGADPGAVVRRLGEETDVSLRRALLLILGEFGPDQLPADERERLTPTVLRLYREDADAGVHGAADWLLRQWGQGDQLKEIDLVWAADALGREEKLERIRGRLGVAKRAGRVEGYWYVNGQGQTMVVVPEPGEFLMGSPPTEVGRERGPEGGPKGDMEKQVPKRIGRSFALAARDVTVEQFLRFRKDFDYNQEYSPTPDCPVNDVSWYEAAEYCNWLTEQELPKEEWEDQRCYLPNDDGKYAAGMKMAPNYLQRMGYRLPTEAEWEYACRAGAATSRYYGESDELLGRFAWYTAVSRDRGMLPGPPAGQPGWLGVPGGVLKPNDLGLFDMLGNAWGWCLDRPYYNYPGADIEDKEDIKYIDDTNSRVLRGGSFGDRAMLVRCANRFGDRPSGLTYVVGFRPARTFR